MFVTAQTRESLRETLYGTLQRTPLGVRSLLYHHTVIPHKGEYHE